MNPFREAVVACKDIPLHGPEEMLERWMEQALTRPIQNAWVEQLLYTLNMLDSRNLEWIDCVLATAKSLGI